MTVKVISIGNSKGIRIPNSILKSLDANAELDLVFNEEKQELLLRPVSKSRAGWSAAFKKMKDNKDDSQLINDSIDLDDKNWQW